MKHQRSLTLFLVLYDYWKISDWIHHYHNPHKKEQLLYDTENCSIKFPDLMSGICLTKRKVVIKLDNIK